MWQYVGSCEVQGKCIIGFEGKCTAIPPRESPVKVVSYEGSTSTALTIDEHQVSSLDQGHVFLASQISGTGSWKVCIEVPMCEDGLALTPVVNCPSNPSILPGCASIEPGGLCKGGECFTSQKLANCEGVAVYQKEMGTTLTLTTTLTQTATSTASIWRIDGPCGVSGACAESPNFPETCWFSWLFYFACFYCHAHGSLRYIYIYTVLFICAVTISDDSISTCFVVFSQLALWHCDANLQWLSFTVWVEIPFWHWGWDPLSGQMHLQNPLLANKGFWEVL